MADGQSVKEDISSEREFFDKYYLETRERSDQPDALAIWIEKARNPNSRPLDLWEYAFYLLGNIKGKNVLDFGCGGGWISRLLAFKGASVSALDISFEGCISTRKKLRESGFRYDSLAVMDAHSIAFRNSSFDAVFITGVLHHLNTARVVPEVHRVLKPGGKVVCYEPLKYGPIMWALRQLWLKLNGLKEYQTTEHEEGLKDSDFAPFNEMFTRGFIRKFNFVAKTNRLRNRFGPLALSLRWIDYVLLSAVPFFRRYCTGVVCYFEK